jgi:hypothetical protein
MKPKCQICTSEEHSTTDHPKDIPEKCINCGGAHEAKYRDCAKQLQKLSIRQPRKPEVGVNPGKKHIKTPSQPGLLTIKIPRKPKQKKAMEPEGWVDWAAETVDDGRWGAQPMDETPV